MFVLYFGNQYWDQMFFISFVQVFPKIPKGVLIQWILYLTKVFLLSFTLALFLSLYCRDRLRTTTNVLGDSIGAGVVEFLSRHELHKADAELGNSVLEQSERMKVPYHPVSQDNECENDKVTNNETKM